MDDRMREALAEKRCPRLLSALVHGSLKLRALAIRLLWWPSSRPAAHRRTSPQACPVTGKYKYRWALLWEGGGGKWCRCCGWCWC